MSSSGFDAFVYILGITTLLALTIFVIFTSKSKIVYITPAFYALQANTNNVHPELYSPHLASLHPSCPYDVYFGVHLCGSSSHFHLYILTFVLSR